jgi:hypothetical protein
MSLKILPNICKVSIKKSLKTGLKMFYFCNVRKPTLKKILTGLNLLVLFGFGLSRTTTIKSQTKHEHTCHEETEFIAAYLLMGTKRQQGRNQNKRKRKRKTAPSDTTKPAAFLLGRGPAYGGLWHEVVSDVRSVADGDATSSLRLLFFSSAIGGPGLSAPA